MCYFSEILGKPVEDALGSPIGRLSDLVVRAPGDKQNPIILAMLIEGQNQTSLIPYVKGTLSSSPIIPLRLPNDVQETFVLEPADFFLARDVLDKPLVNSQGRRKALVSDLKFENKEGWQGIKAIDVGNLGILRRCNLVKTAQSIASHQRFELIEHLIPWETVQFDLEGRSLRLTSDLDAVSEQYNTALARVLPGLNRYQRKQFIENLDDTRLTEIFLQIEPEVQSSAALNLTDDRLARVILEMAPDDAVSLLSRLSKSSQNSVLAKINPEAARLLQKLLYYPYNTVGRLMTTSYRTARPEQTAEEAINMLRQSKDGAGAGDAVYITDANNHLAGITNLTDLAMAGSQTRVASLMSNKVISVWLMERVEDLAPMILRYNLQAVPVVDENNVLRGVVLAKDALDKRVPPTWKKRQAKIHVHPVTA